MKNIKKTSLYFVLAFSIFKLSCVGENLGLSGLTKLSNSIEKTAEVFSATGVQAAQGLGVESTRIAANAAVEATQIAANAGIEVANITAQGAITASERFGLKAAKQLAPAVQAAVAIYGCGQVYVIGKDIYSSRNPDEENTARINEAREKNQYYDARRVFRSCLMTNARTERNASGLPTACEDLAQQFIMAAGKSGFEEMAETFRTAYRE